MVQAAGGNSVGAGQFQPTDANSRTSVIAFIVRQMLAQIDTAKLVKIVGVHPGSGTPPAIGTVDVLPLINLLDGSGNSTQQGTVYGLPYYRLGAGKWAIICDPVVGDVGLAIASDRDISAAKNAFASGNTSPQSNPGSYRKFDISDGIYVGLCLAQAPANFLWLNPDGSFKLSDGLGNVLESSADGLSLTLPAGGKLAVSGDLQVTGAITAGQGGADSVGVQTHQHTSETAGTPTSAPLPGT